MQRFKAKLAIRHSRASLEFCCKLQLQIPHESGCIRWDRFTGDLILRFLNQASAVQPSPGAQTEERGLNMPLCCEPLERGIDPAVERHVGRRHLEIASLLRISPIGGAGGLEICCHDDASNKQRKSSQH